MRLWKCSLLVLDNALNEEEFSRLLFSITSGLDIENSLSDYHRNYKQNSSDNRELSASEGSNEVKNINFILDGINSENKYVECAHLHYMTIKFCHVKTVFINGRNEVVDSIFDMMFTFVMVFYVFFNYNNSKATATVHVLFSLEIVQLTIKTYLSACTGKISRITFCVLIIHLFVLIAYSILMAIPNKEATSNFIVACSFRLLMCFRSSQLLVLKLSDILVSSYFTIKFRIGFSKGNLNADENSKYFTNFLDGALNVRHFLRSETFVQDFIFIAMLMFIASYTFVSIGQRSFGGLIIVEDSTTESDSYNNLVDSSYVQSE